MRMPLPHKRQAGQAQEKRAQATGQEREAQNGWRRASGCYRQETQTQHRRVAAAHPGTPVPARINGGGFAERMHGHPVDRLPMNSQSLVYRPVADERSLVDRLTEDNQSSLVNDRRLTVGNQSLVGRDPRLVGREPVSYQRMVGRETMDYQSLIGYDPRLLAPGTVGSVLYPRMVLRPERSYPEMVRREPVSYPRMVGREPMTYQSTVGRATVGYPTMVDYGRMRDQSLVDYGGRLPDPSSDYERAACKHLGL